MMGGLLENSLLLGFGSRFQSFVSGLILSLQFGATLWLLERGKEDFIRAG